MLISILKHIKITVLAICIVSVSQQLCAQKYDKEKIILYCADIKRPLSQDDKTVFNNSFYEMACANKRKISSIKVKIIYVPFSIESEDNVTAKLAIDEFIKYFGTIGVTKVTTKYLPYFEAIGHSDCETIPLWITYGVK